MMNCMKPAGFDKLETKLLSIGGNRVMTMHGECQTDALLHRGHVFSTNGRKLLKCSPDFCHEHAALHYVSHHALENGGLCKLATGYALHESGLWVEHSWLWDGHRVIEPNAEPVQYFGLVLTPDEAHTFLFNNVLKRLPGADEIIKRGKKQLASRGRR
jgi:hypothetical protein